MSNRNFTMWLNNEVAATRCILLSLYEKRDMLLYMEGPRLENEYMEKVGAYEETVIRAEMEYEILIKKQQIIQTALNRREVIDEKKIDAELDTYRKEMLKDAEGVAPQNYASLSAEESDELQKIYRAVIDNYHPQTHPELTDAHRLLYEKAQDAYRRKDLTALQLIYKMLCDTQPDNALMMGSMLEMSIELDENNSSENGFLTDYSLCAMIYNQFKHTVEEATIKEEISKYKELLQEVTAEIENINKKFPYTASEMLSDEKKIEEYKKELEYRLKTATENSERLKEEIRKMIGSVTAHE